MAKRQVNLFGAQQPQVTSASNLIQAYRKAPSRAEATRILKRLAVVIVDLRSQYTLSDGRPDWSGRSSEYREAISEIYRRGGIPEAELDTFQAALRYHVGNRLREVAPAEELKDAGLGNAGPRERLHQARNIVSAVNGLVSSGGTLIIGTPESEVSPLDSLLIADRILREARIGDIPPEERGVARDVLVRIAKTCIDML